MTLADFYIATETRIEKAFPSYKKVKEGDKEKLAKGTGIVFIISGIVTILLPYFLYWFGNTMGIIYCLLIIIVIVVILWVKSKR